MEHGEKIKLWREFSKSKGWKFVYPAPHERLLMKITGKECSPSYFWPFWSQVVFTGMSWGLFWGVFMFVSVWRDKTLLQIIVPSLAGGFLFGLFMALIHLYTKRKFELSTWDKFGEGPINFDNRA